MFTFTPLLGSQSSSSASQSIIELDGGVKILIDVGWDEHFDASQISDLERHLPTLSFILLTHATTSHLGAYAHLSKNFPLFAQIPVYATTPVISLGRTLLQDLYSSTPLAATFLPTTGSATEGTVSSISQDARSVILKQAPSAEEITKYFQRITPLKYSQPHQPIASDFSPPLEGVVLTAYNAGHTLGGTMWLIQHGMESIIYAVDWNQARENVMGSAAWFGGYGGSEVIEPLRKPSALVCSTTNGDSPTSSGGRKKRDQLLIDNLRSSLIKGGTVLIPSDSSARVLEVAYVLEKAWQQGTSDPTFPKARVYLASRSAVATMKHAQSLLEWMDDSVVRAFEGEDDNLEKSHKRMGSKQPNGLSTKPSKPSKPFEFEHVTIIERPKQLEKALEKDGPKVILASDKSFSWGLSKIALRSIAGKPENLVVLTEKAHMPGNQDLLPTQRLWQILQNKEDGVALEKSSDGGHIEQVHSGGRSMDLVDFERHPLDAKEQQIYQQYMATQRQLHGSLTSRTGNGVEETENIADDSSSSTSSASSDGEHQGHALNVSAALGHAGRAKRHLSDRDLGVSVLLRKKGVYDFDVRQFKRGRNAVFPYIHQRRRGDEFGEYIKSEDYLRAEEKEDNTDAKKSLPEAKLGQKRKWHETENGRSRMNDGKRQKANKSERMGEQQPGRAQNSGDDESDESDASDGEPEQNVFEGPGKVLLRTDTIVLNARLTYVDFAGLHDQRSLQNLIELIDPRKLVLTRGTQQETSRLASDCATLLAAKEKDRSGQPSVNIFTPFVGQTIDASVDTNAWTVRLSHSLVQRLQWQNVHGSGVVTLAAQLRGEQPLSDDSEPGDVKSKRRKTTKSSPVDKDSDPEHAKAPGDINAMLDLVPTTMAGAIRSTAQPLHVGDMRLADLRRLMGTIGYTAEFRGEGTLVINGTVAVRKLGVGKIVIEGSPISPSIMTPEALPSLLVDEEHSASPPRLNVNATREMTRAPSRLGPYVASAFAPQWTGDWAVVHHDFADSHPPSAILMMRDSERKAVMIQRSACSDRYITYKDISGRLVQLGHQYLLQQSTGIMTRTYRYMTKDGQPPNKGTPPGVPRPNAKPQSVATSTCPTQPAPMAASAAPSTAPPGFCWLPAPAPGPIPVYAPAPTPTPPPPYFPPAQQSSEPSPVHGAAQPAPGVQGGTGSTISPGARVRGQLPVFPGRNSGYIYGKKQSTFNIIEGRTKPWRSPGCEIQFTTVHADCRMPVKEFIEQVGAAERAPARTSEAAIGICEVVETGNGTWRKGSQFLLGSAVGGLSQSLAEVGWDEFRGEAGVGKPIWLVLMP